MLMEGIGASLRRRTYFLQPFGSFENMAPEGSFGAQTQDFGSACSLGRQILAVLLHLHRLREQCWCLGVRRDPCVGRAGLAGGRFAFTPFLCCVAFHHAVSQDS